MSTREEIIKAAREFLMVNGFRGLRFSDIADRLGITRANVHYHFGNKSDLVDVVIHEYMDEVIGHFEAIWYDSRTSYREKVLKTSEFNGEKYHRFNPSGTGGVSWSLIDRMRQDMDLLSETSQSQLRRIDVVQTFVGAAVHSAQTRGELASDAPADQIAQQIMIIIDCACTITQASNNFERLRQAYTSHVELIYHAYGGDKVMTTQPYILDGSQAR